ncbi:metalloprotease TldD, partial [Escherichia coli]
AYADQISLLALEQSAQAARTIVRDSGDGKVQTLGAVEHSPLYTSVDPLQSMSREEKLDILRRVDKVAREADKRVQEVTASLSGVYELILVAATDGTLAADVRPLVRLSVSVLVEEDGKRERGASGGGGRFGYEFFLADLDGEVRSDAWAKEAVRMALVNLSAVAAPAGTMPVVLGAGWPGVLLHEAVGHGLEGDFNRRGTSVFSGQVGELVASELCTVVDDGTMVDRRGSVAIDDEGTPGQYNVLIENGILKGYMQDKLNARLMGMTPTGNGRRESYAHLPMPRMTNTYMLPGKSTPQEIIESVEYGIYAPNFGGGQVDITSGKFVFSTSEAYLIENGKVTKPVKGATLIGSGIETMQQISMVGNDLKLDNGVGVCGKEGQSLPVGVGQPTLKVDNLTVGGTA